jgi:hypothetical protein
MGLLDLTPEDEQRAINAGLLRAGLSMMMPVRGGRGKFAPQFAQGALEGVDAYGRSKDELTKRMLLERQMQQQARAQAEQRQAAEALANSYGQPDMPQQLSPALMSRPSPAAFQTPQLPDFKMPASQNYGLFNPRGRIPNVADMESDEREQMALEYTPNGYRTADDISQIQDINDESSVYQNTINNASPTEVPYPATTFKEGEIPTLPTENVTGMRKRPTEPFSPLPQFDLREPAIPATPGINPAAAPLQSGTRMTPNQVARYRAIRNAISQGVPHADEDLKAFYKELEPKFSNVAPGSSVFNERTRQVEYSAPEKVDVVDAGGKWLFRRGDQIIGEAPKTLSPDEAARIAQQQSVSDRKFKDDLFKNANTLRDEFNNQAKTFATIGQAHRQVVVSAQDPSPAGDLSLLYGYMKTLDPGSVVRESEFALAAQAGSLDERVQGWVEKVLTGQRLTDSQRADFVGRSQKLYESAVVDHNKLVKRYEGIAVRNNVPIVDVLGDFSTDIKLPAEMRAPDVTQPLARTSPVIRGNQSKGPSAPRELPAGTTFNGYAPNGNRLWRLPNGRVKEQVE